MATTLQAAGQIGVCKNTLLRWISEGLIADVHRDWRGWRVWSPDDIRKARAFRDSYHDRPIPRARRRPLPRARYAGSLGRSLHRYGEALRKRARDTR